MYTGRMGMMGIGGDVVEAQVSAEASYDHEEDDDYEY